MKRIDNRSSVARQGNTGPGETSDEAWKPQAGQEVRRIRSVVTMLDEEPSVSDEMAPMMSEFLARLDGMSEPPPLLHEPPTFGGEPMSPLDVAETVRGVVDSIEGSEFGSRMREDGPVAQMVSEVKGFLELRRACIARCSNAAQ
jgi:hypothetical protein